MSAAAPTLGGRLKAERELRGLSTQKAAEQLHLDAWVIEALESGDYARIGPAVYGKGHLKRYALLLGLPIDEVLEAYEPNSGAPAMPSEPAPRLRMRTSEPLGLTIPWAPAGGLAAALVIAGILWWRPWQAHKAVPAAAAVSDPAVRAGSQHGPVAAGRAGDGDAPVGNPAVGTAPAAAAATAADSAGAATSPRATPSAPAAGSPRPTPPAPAASLHPAAPPGGAEEPGVGRARLRLSFSADSWVEVHDATGRSLFAGNGRANSVKTVAGAAPMTVYLGFASGVQLQVNNRAVAIGPQFVAGDAAHFAAGADGVLRRDLHAPAPIQPHPRG